MANIRTCDRCGNQIAVDPTNDVTFGAGKCVVYHNDGRILTFGYDLCPKCTEKLDNFLKSKE